MPIVENPRADAPLSQGDILTHLRFFSTANCWSDKDIEAARGKFEEFRDRLAPFQKELERRTKSE
jgi:hypothetical protein